MLLCLFIKGVVAMSVDAWVSVTVVLTIFPLMAFSRLGPDIILLGAVIVLMTLGVIDPQQALGGFSNSGLFTVAFMYVLVASIRETGGIDLIIRYVLGRPDKERGALIRLLLPVATLSAFVNNTPCGCHLYSCRHELEPQAAFISPAAADAA